MVVEHAWLGIGPPVHSREQAARSGRKRDRCGRGSERLERSRDRLIGICYLDGVDIGETIIREGLARDCPRYSKGRYAQAEEEAKRKAYEEAQRRRDD